MRSSRYRRTPAMETAQAARPVPANFPISGNAARRLVEIRDRMAAELGRPVTYTQVLERLLSAADFAGKA
jgi:hypothetical protein